MWDDDEEPEGPYRDGHIHVLEEQCTTCIFRPGNKMRLNPGRLREMVRSALRDGSSITCHQTLSYGGYNARPAVCRGFYDNYSTPPLRLAQILRLVEFDPAPTETVGRVR